MKRAVTNVNFITVHCFRAAVGIYVQAEVIRFISPTTGSNIIREFIWKSREVSSIYPRHLTNVRSLAVGPKINFEGDELISGKMFIILIPKTNRQPCPKCIPHPENCHPKSDIYMKLFSPTIRHHVDESWTSLTNH